MKDEKLEKLKKAVADAKAAKAAAVYSYSYAYTTDATTAYADAYNKLVKAKKELEDYKKEVMG